MALKLKTIIVLCEKVGLGCKLLDTYFKEKHVFIVTSGKGRSRAYVPGVMWDFDFIKSIRKLENRRILQYSSGMLIFIDLRTTDLLNTLTEAVNSTDIFWGYNKPIILIGLWKYKEQRFSAYEEIAEFCNDHGLVYIEVNEESNEEIITTLDIAFQIIPVTLSRQPKLE
jgi:hypothetical protein